MFSYVVFISFSPNDADSSICIWVVYSGPKTDRNLPLTDIIHILYLFLMGVSGKPVMYLIFPKLDSWPRSIEGKNRKMLEGIQMKQILQRDPIE